MFGDPNKRARPRIAIAYDAGLDQYYLRARYYAQGVGRFTQQDMWMGKDSDPMTLHKYLYANGDGVNYTDPSGQMSLMMTGMNLQISLNITTTLVARTMVTRSMLAAGLRYGLQAIKKEVKICLRQALLGKGNRCKLDVPIVIAANDYPNQRQHIQDAQEGLGSNISNTPLPVVLRYQSGSINRKSWPKSRFSPRGLEGCTTQDRVNSELVFRSKVQCDEYPFNTSIEGGYSNFLQGKVATRYIPQIENSKFGGMIGSLNKMHQGDYFIVMPLDMVWKSIIINIP